MEVNTDEITRLAELLLSPDEIAVTLSIPVPEVKEWMEDNESDFFISFTRGRANAKQKLNEINYRLMSLGAPNALKSIQEQLQ